MILTKEQDEAITWAEQCIAGHRRGKGEIEFLKRLLDIINEQAAEIQLLTGGKE